MAENNCYNCIHFAQGANSSYCDNPKQDNKALKSYVYSPYTCNLHKKGDMHKTRVIHMIEILEFQVQDSNKKLIELKSKLDGTRR